MDEATAIWVGRLPFRISGAGDPHAYLLVPCSVLQSSRPFSSLPAREPQAESWSGVTLTFLLPQKVDETEADTVSAPTFMATC